MAFKKSIKSTGPGLFVQRRQPIVKDGDKLAFSRELFPKAMLVRSEDIIDLEMVR